MKKFSVILLSFILVFGANSWSFSTKKSRFKKLKEMDREDEYANSIRRRNYFKDRLVAEVGAGSKFFAMGEQGASVGVGLEYITRYGIAPFVTYGVVPKTNSSHFNPDGSPAGTRQGGSGYKLGLAYYLFPKIPMHLGIAASYGKNYYDFKGVPDADGTEEILFNTGYQLDLTLTYLSYAWYYLTVNVGLAYSGNALPGTENTSREKSSLGTLNAVVTPESGLLKDYTLVFGIGIGFALPDMFPDNTEIRRRQREKKRKQLEH